MKKSMINSLLLGTLIIITIASCSKDALDPMGPGADGNSQKYSAAKSGGGESNKGTTGWVTGTVSPIKNTSTVTLTNGTYTYGPYTVDLSSGTFKIAGVQPGTYKLIITNPSDSSEDDVADTQVIVIEVRANEVTNVGEIKF